MQVIDNLLIKLRSKNAEDLVKGLETLGDLVEVGAVTKADMRVFVSRLSQILDEVENDEVMNDIVNIFLKVQVDKDVLPVMAGSLERNFPRLPKGAAEDALAILAEYVPENIDRFIGLISKHADASTKQAIQEALVASEIVLGRKSKKR